MVFLACVHLALFLALSLSPGNSFVSSWYECLVTFGKALMYKPRACLLDSSRVDGVNSNTLVVIRPAAITTYIMMT